MKLPLNVDWQQILLHLMNFVILFAILYFLLYSPIKKFMDKRAEYYKKIDEEANKNLHEAENTKKMYEEKLNNADEEIEKKMQEANKAIYDKIEKSEAEAKLRADEIIALAQKKAEREHDEIIESAQAEIADMVTKATEKIVNSGTSESYEEFLKAVERGTDNE